MKRVLFASLHGGIAMFVWAFVAHEVLPLGEAGVREIPNEAPVLSAMRSSIGDASGFYIFSGYGRRTERIVIAEADGHAAI
jgi:hypothetical protein